MHQRREIIFSRPMNYDESDELFYKSLFFELESPSQSVEESDLEKTISTARLLRNRESAKKSRERKRDLILDLQTRCAILEKQNRSLVHYINGLRIVAPVPVVLPIKKRN